MSGVITTKIEGEVYTHRVLWQTAKHLIQVAETPKGAFYPHLAAMLTLYFVVEAYLNFVLDVLDPEAFKQERKRFGGDMGQKAAHVCSVAGLTLDRGAMPYQFIAYELGVLRDKVVHAKPETYDPEIRGVDPDELPFMQPTEFDRRVSGENCERAVQVVQQFCTMIHAAALNHASAQQRLRLGPEPLDGPTQIQTTSSSVAH